MHQVLCIFDERDKGAALIELSTVWIWATRRGWRYENCLTAEIEVIEQVIGCVTGGKDK